jgi:hypothetical protein
MSDVKISQLPSASSAANNAVLPIVDSGTTSQLTIANLAGSLPQVTSSISASFANNATSASYALTASFALNAGGAINTGSFATTGSNTFKGDQTISGSITVTNTIKGTGSLILQPDANDVRYLQVYNTSPTDTHITASGGQLFLGDDQTYVKVDNYGSVDRIDIVAGNLINVSSSVQFTGSVSSANGFTGSLQGTASFAISASFAPGGSGPISVSGSTLYSNDPVTSGFTTINGIFFGSNAGLNATSADSSNFLGFEAGNGATNSGYANFIGYQAGWSAPEALLSNFIGFQAGWNADSASDANFVGYQAGFQATRANFSNFMGWGAGSNATSASYSNFIGFKAGASTSPSSNNIVIGTNITLANSRKDSVNIGGIIFATGSYSTTTGNAFSGSMTEAKVGINKSLPEYTLDVSGSGNFTNGLNITGSSFTIGNIQVNSQTLGVLALGVTGSTTISDGSLRVRESSTDVAGGFLVNPASDFFSFAQQDASTELTIALSGSIAFGFGNAPSATRFLSTKGFQFTTNAGRNVEVSSSFKVSGSADFNAGLTITSGSLSVGNGFTVLTTVSQSLNFVDDAAAATGGVPLGGLYRSGSFVLIRLV